MTGGIVGKLVRGDLRWFEIFKYRTRYATLGMRVLENRQTYAPMRRYHRGVLFCMISYKSRPYTPEIRSDIRDSQRASIFSGEAAMRRQRSISCMQGNMWRKRECIDAAYVWEKLQQPQTGRQGCWDMLISLKSHAVDRSHDGWYSRKARSWWPEMV